MKKPTKQDKAAFIKKVRGAKEPDADDIPKNPKSKRVANADDAK